MKNFFKKVAFVLALAMVLTNIGPAASASAAEAPGVRYKSRVIYVGGSENDNYPDNCWTPSKNNEGWKATYSTNSNIIDLTSNGKITANGKGIGLAVVNVTYSKAGQKDVYDTFNVKVRRNATAVRLINATKAKIDEALKIGDVIELSSAKSITMPASYAKGNYGLDNYRGVCSDLIAYASSNDEVFKVEGNKLTAVGNGTATLTVYTYQYLDTTKTPVVYADYEITVAGGMLNVKQTSATTLTVAMGQEVADAKASDFAITRVNDTVDFGIKGISLSSDKKTVTIETYSSMNDGEDYTVSYDDKNITFTATNGKVVDMKINKTVIPYNFATTITVDLLDKDGIVLANVKESTAADNNVEWNWVSVNGATYDDKLVLYSKNDTAELKVTYRPGEYDKDGNEINVVGPQTYKIVAMDVAVDANLLATVATNPDSVCVYNWSGVAANGENRAIIAEDPSKQLHVYITDTQGNEVTQNLFEDYGYYLESSNENVLTIGSYASHDHTEYPNGNYIDDVGIFAEIYGVKAGTANVLIKNSDDKVVFTIKVTVNAPRKFVGFDTNASTLTLSNTLYAVDKQTVEVVAKDQYGRVTELYEQADFVTVEPVKADTDTREWPVVSAIRNEWNKIALVDFRADGFGGNDSADAGSYRFKVTFEKDGVTATRFVTIVVKDYDNNGSDSYKVVTSGDFDTTCLSYANTRTANIQIAHYKGGVLYEYLGYDSSSTNNNNGIYIKELTITNGKNQTTIEGSALGASYTSTGVDGAGSAIDRLGTLNASEGANKYPYYLTVANDEVLNGVANPATVTGTAIKKTSTGTRNVKATIVDPNKANDVIVNGSFTINDNQESMTATVDKTTVSAGTIGEMIKEALTFKHEGYKEINDGAEANRIVIKKIKVNSNPANDIDGSTIVASGYKTYVTSVVIGFTCYNNNKYVEYTVPVNRTITIK